VYQLRGVSGGASPFVGANHAFRIAPVSGATALAASAALALAAGDGVILQVAHGDDDCGALTLDSGFSAASFNSAPSTYLKRGQHRIYSVASGAVAPSASVANPVAMALVTLAFGNPLEPPIIVSAPDGPSPIAVAGRGPSGSTIDLRIDGSSITTGVATVDANGDWSALVSLTDGPHTIEARQNIPAPGSLTLSDVSVSSVMTTTAELSVTISGTIPVGSLMLIQLTEDIFAGPWLGSDEPTDAEAGVFTFAATGLTAGTTYYCRASVYTEGTPTVIHAVTALTAFATEVASAAPSYSRMVHEMDDASDGQAMTWGSWANNPNNVDFVGGPGGKPCPAVTAAGALVRGTTVPADTYGGFGGLPELPSEYRDSDPWTIYTQWVVVIEQGALRTGAGAVMRLNAETNLAIQFERSIFEVWLDSLGAYQTIRDRTDLQTWYTASEDWLIANGAVETRAPTAAEGAGIIVRWPSGGNAVHGSLVKGPIGMPLSTWENGVDLSSIVTDIRQIVIASRLRAVPWNPNAPFNPANVKLVAHVGCDVRVVDPHPWAIPPAVLSRQRSVSTTWDWYTACTLRDTIRQDRQDGGSSAEAGFTKSQALSSPIPGWGE